MAMRLKSAFFAATVLAVAPMTSATVSAQQMEPNDAVAPQTHDTQLNLNNGARRLVIQTDAAAVNYSNSGSWVQVTAGVITIPSGQRGIIVGTFTAESNCSGRAGSWCS